MQTRLLRSVQAPLTAWIVPAALALLSAGCQSTAATPDGDPANSARAAYQHLYRLCLEHHGGLRMDAMDLYAGRLSGACSRWAYRHARQ